LRTDAQRLDESEKKIKIMKQIPALNFKRIVAKDIIQTLVSHKVNSEELEQMQKEINEATVFDLDPEVIANDMENGLVSTEYASTVIRGYPEGQVEQAKKDHAERLKRIMESQTNDNGSQTNDNGSQTNDKTNNPASRGLDDLEDDNDSSSNEKKFSQSKYFNKQGNVRGKGRFNNQNDNNK
jgi:hypothetical protein